MSVTYQAVQWNRHKVIYDRVLVAGVLAYLIAFMAVAKLVFGGRDAIGDEILIMRALGTCAFVMLHIILCIGPLARLSPKFNPLLYNRRHFGVTMFLVALAHGIIALGYYHGFGVMNPLVSLLTNGGSYTSFRDFPFQVLGAGALVILFLMAATSHDFWLKNLSPRVWKSLHMLVYVAYSLLVLHVVLGALQAERSPVLAGLVIAGLVFVCSLHLIAGWRETQKREAPREEWIDVAATTDIPDGRGVAVRVANGEPIAVFRKGDSFSALTNVCAHQQGPLSEGKIVDGCVTCPWHGYQYLPENGQSPPPFTEKIPTFRVRVQDDRVQVNPEPLSPGTPVAPARVADSEDQPL